MNTSIQIGVQDNFAKTPAWFRPANFLAQEANGVFIHGRSGAGKTTALIHLYGVLSCHLWENYGIYAPILHIASTATDAFKMWSLAEEYEATVDPETEETIYIHPAEMMDHEVWMPAWDAGKKPPWWVDKKLRWMPPMMNLKTEMDLARLQLDTQYAYWLEKMEKEFWSARSRHSPFTAKKRNQHFENCSKAYASEYKWDNRTKKDIEGRVLPTLLSVREEFKGAWKDFEELFRPDRFNGRVPFLQLNLANSSDVSDKFAFLNGMLTAIFNHGWKWTHNPDPKERIYLILIIDDINEYCPKGWPEESYRYHLKETILNIARKGRRYFLRGAVANMKSTVDPDFLQEVTFSAKAEYGHVLSAVDITHKVGGFPHTMYYLTKNLLFDPTPPNISLARAN